MRYSGILLSIFVADWESGRQSHLFFSAPCVFSPLITLTSLIKDLRTKTHALAWTKKQTNKQKPCRAIEVLLKNIEEKWLIMFLFYLFFSILNLFNCNYFVLFFHIYHIFYTSLLNMTFNKNKNATVWDW